MKTTMLGFLAESSIHCGAGRSAGIIDLPVAREAATDYPFVAGSGLKGALRDHARSVPLEEAEVSVLFGKQEHAGGVLVSDARLLLLPVRSLTGAYRWVTCPLILERYHRDLSRCGIRTSFEIPPIDPGHVLTSGAQRLYLEEREFSIAGGAPADVVAAISPLVRHLETRNRLAQQIAIIRDDDLAWFCRYAVPLQARNVLEDGTKKSVNLWYEESLPPDTLLYALTTTRDDEARRLMDSMFQETDPYLQIGGNETVGHGWVAVVRHGKEVES